MPVSVALATFNAAINQCDALIANAHQQTATGSHLLPTLDREQITRAAFLNMFIAWEAFIEEAMLAFMVGSPTINGTLPTRFVFPSTLAAAGRMIVGTMKYFDYIHHDNVRKVSAIFFDNAYPFDGPLRGITSDLQDLKQLRNGCAHITSSTQRNVETIALRLIGAPQPGIGVYDLIIKVDPNNAPDTIYETYKKKLLAAATMIAHG